MFEIILGKVFLLASMKIKLGKLTNSCFVIMPFTPTFKTVYERVIKPAVEEVKLECIRSDEIYSKPHIMSDIWKSLRSARIVIAELTGRNTNVFYELGLAHAIGKPVIIITRNQDDVPFDLKALRYMQYNTEDPFWGDNLKKNLISMLRKVLDEKGYGTVFEDIEFIGKEEYPKKEILKEKKELIADLSGKWIGNMKIGGLNYRVDLVLEQTVTTLSGSMLVTYTYEDKQSIVEESVVGEIENDSVTLYGVTYSFIEQGASEGYSLDNFSLKLSLDERKLKGKVTSEEEKGNIVLSKREIKKK